MRNNLFRFVCAVVGILGLGLLFGAVPDLHASPAFQGIALAFAGFGVPFRPQPNAVVRQNATPPGGDSAEVIWHQLFDTQTFTSAATTRLQFFTTTNADRTLSNLEQGGTLPSPQSLQIHNITCDFLAIVPVSTSATLTGVLNDFALLTIGSGQRPVWTLNINNKDYGPYSLTTLHGTGAPQGFGFSGDGAEVIEYAHAADTPGWNYFGRVTILPQNAFRLTVDYAATATLTGDTRVRVSLWGVLNRKTQ